MEARLRTLYPDHTGPEIATAMGMSLRQIYAKAQELGIKKTREWIAERARAAMADPNHGAHRTRFAAGQKPWNTGTHYQAGGRSKEHQFKPGQKPHTWNPIGHERVTKEGYLQRKVSDTGYTPRDYVAVHHLVWIEHNGPVPPGHALAFRNGDKTDIRLDNLELVTRAELMRRNSVHNLPKDVALAVQMLGALQRQINNREDRPE